MNLLSLSIPRLAIAAATLLSVMVPLGAAPEQQHPVKPMLWKVEGPGLEKPSYLFGTMHVGGKSVVTLHPAAEKAFESATVLHTEAAMDMKSQLASMKDMMRTDGKMLDASIGEDLAKRFDAELKKVNPELDSAPFQPMKTWLVAYMIPFLPEQMKGIKPLDMVLWERADKAGKETAGMQETKDQVAGFNQLTEDEQIALLRSTLDSLDKDRRAGRDRMKEAADLYVAGDPDKLDAFATESLAELVGGKDGPLAEKLIKSILKDRDVIMAEYIAATLKKNPGDVHFFAAGAAHYASADSVRSKLEKQGYKITRIEE
jgi:uncharacterized protein YbaP (TraB family)